jgi:hypothetical protein
MTEINKTNSSTEKITKTYAMQKYMLRAKDLEDIPSHTYNRKKYGKNICITLYLESDVHKCAITRWGSDENIEIERSKRQDKQIKIRENKKIMKDKRREELILALKDKGLQLRDDSKLCQNYIDGIKDLSLSEIVDICLKMNWLYTCTDYQDRLNIYFDNIKKHHDKYNVEEDMESIRREIIREHGGNAPWRE